ncbi:hypothetical protein [Catellatospora sp. NPDC049133]|uniref:hypothetical protein n=1 Tax=Catellatospora sp. NPDC049133 TaxID=3155499 RepID=UPI00340F53EB
MVFPVPANPMDLLSAMTGASAGMVAIVGGLLVSRYIGLDAEQQGAASLLADAEERLAVADRRYAEAVSDLARFELHRMLLHSVAMESLIHDVTEPRTELRTIRMISEQHCISSDAELQPHFTSVIDLIRRTRKELEEALPDEGQGPDFWKNRMESGFIRLPLMARAGIRDDLSAAVWSAVYDQTVDYRYIRAEHRNRESGGTPSGQQSLREWTDAPEEGVATVNAVRDASLQAKLHSLSSERDRAIQRREDVHAERDRLAANHAAVVKPKGLLLGLLVLVFGSVVGVVLPVMKMASGPEEFDQDIPCLVAGFFAGVTVLLVYLASLAARLVLPGRKTRT